MTDILHVTVIIELLTLYKNQGWDYKRGTLSNTFSYLYP